MGVVYEVDWITLIHGVRSFGSYGLDAAYFKAPI